MLHLPALTTALLALSPLPPTGPAPPALRLDPPSLRLASVFRDHAVLQADRPIVVWGWSRAGAEVTVGLGAARASVVAGDDGRWSVELPSLAADGTPRTLVATSGEEGVTVNDVLVGEVWLASGQSNMVWTVERSAGLDEVRAAAAERGRVRVFHAPPVTAATPQAEVSGTWIVAAPETVGRLSAVAYHFACALEDELGVPIGIVLCARGGSAVEAWTDAETLRAQPEAAAILDRWEACRTEVERGTAWADAELDDSEWGHGPLPGALQELGLGETDPVVWFRRTVTVPEAWAGRRLVLDLGRTDDTDDTWVAGAHVGGSVGADRDSRYAFEAPAPGPATIAVRVRDNGGRGGFTGAAESFVLHPEDAPEDRLQLAGPWRWRVGSPRPIVNPRHRPAHHWNAMIAPLLDLGVRGVIWYQGEANASRAEQYAALFPDMIRAWRARFGRPELPFLFVQLPNFETGNDWPGMREAQLLAHRALEHTGIAVAIDVGEPGDIHPQEKRPVGARLARWALRDVYGRAELAPSGPLFIEASFAVEGRAVVRFETFGGMLAAGDGEALGGFELAGTDRVFHAATARVEGDSVVVASEAVSAPVAVRYGWASNPAGVNLVGADGLPASPFRSDRWELASAGRR